MRQDDLLYVMAAAVTVSAIALIWQALLLFGVYKFSKIAREKVTTIAGQVESFVLSAQRSLEHRSKQVSDVANRAGEVLDLVYKQLVRIDDVMEEATAEASSQMDRVELALDDTIGELHTTVALLNKRLLRPVREVNGIAAGIKAALGYLLRSQRVTVERTTHEEECHTASEGKRRKDRIVQQGYADKKARPIVSPHGARADCKPQQ